MNRLREPLEDLQQCLEACSGNGAGAAAIGARADSAPSNRQSMPPSKWALADVSTAHFVQDALDVIPGVCEGLEEWQEREVAQWGEEWVYNWLSQRQHTSSGATVMWHNKDNEAFLPYDISVSFSSGQVFFYEVKSTIMPDKQLAEISEVQIIEAASRKEAFFLVRVFGAGTRSPRMLVVQNPSNQWQPKNNKNTNLELMVSFPTQGNQGTFGPQA